MIPKKMNTIAIIFILLLIPSTMVSAEPLLPEVRETLLGKIPKGYQIIPASIKMSADLRNVSFVAYSDNTHNIVHANNQTSPVYYAVQPNMPIWDRFSERYAYIAYKNKEEAVVVVNGKKFGNIETADNFIFSPFESRFAFRAQKNKRQFVVVDGKPGMAYDGIPIKDNFTFSPNGKRFIYVALKNNNCVAVVDGREELLSFNFIESVRFSPDSSQYAYKARTEKAINKEKWCMVKDGQAGNVYDHIFDLIFSPDSKHLAYTVIKDRKMMLVFDGHEMDLYDRVGLPVFSFDSKIFAYAYMENDRWYIMLGDQRSTPFDQIFKFYFSLDSKRNAFFAKNDDESFCVVNGEKEPDFEKTVATFKFSPDSSRYVYAGVDENGSRIITDGNPGHNYLSVGEPYFSPDSRHVVYRAFRPRGEAWATVLDGKESAKKYYGIGKYKFSPDSKHLAFPASISINQSVMVVDGIEQCSDNNFKILGDPFFSPDGNYIVYHARAGKEKWHLIINGHVLPEIYGGFFKGTHIIFDSPTRFHTLGIKPGGTEFVVIDVEIPETLKLTSGLNSL